MSYSLAIADGDLAKRGSQMALVFGVNKLKQDMNCWLLEQYGGVEGYLRHIRELDAERLQREREEAERRESAELGKPA